MVEIRKIPKKNISPEASEVINRKPISDTALKGIRDSLVATYPDMVIDSLFDDELRPKLEEIVLKDYGSLVNKDPNIAKYVVKESIGTGVIEDILLDPEITDIGWNGTDLFVETNSGKEKYDTGDIEINEEYINRIVQKFANAVGRPFDDSNPVLDAVYKNIRLSATHYSISPNGTTMSMRVVRPRLALNKGNFDIFAPKEILEFFKYAMLTHNNLAISGEVGTGKTEVQKLLLSFVPTQDKIIMVEDVQETHVKELFPEKDIYSWITSHNVTIADQVKNSLRNNPKWVIVSETRGKEAYEMLQAVLSGHHIVTTLHAVSANAIPRRFVNMIAEGYNITSSSVEEDIRNYFDYGLHIKKIKINGKVIRFLSEIVEFNVTENKTIFEQRYRDGVFYYKTNQLSEHFYDLVSEQGLSYQFPVTDKDDDWIERIETRIEEV